MRRSLPASLPTEAAGAGTTLTRIHFDGTPEPFFGPAAGDPPTQRFHDPLGKFRVCFLGENATASFVETLLRKPPVRLVTRDELSPRRLTTFRLRRGLNLVSLYGSGLARLGCTADITSSLPPYEGPQQMARALWEHADRPDGLSYLCRHDNALFALALFDRAADALEFVRTEQLVGDRVRLLAWSDRYGFRIA
jgi:hypothetical protein